MLTEPERGSPGVSIPQLAGEFGVSETLLYSLATTGRLPGCRRLGRRFVVHRETFEEWLRSGTGDEQAGGESK